MKNAQLAQSPLVIIGGATATALRGRGSLQDIDQTSLMRPHVKWMARPNTLREVVPAVEEAFFRAQDGVPGPVFVELAVDLLYPEAVVRDWSKKQLDKPNKTLADHGISTLVRGNLAYRFAFSSDPSFAPPAAAEPPVATAAEVATAAKTLANAERPLMVLGSQTMLRPHRVPELIAAIETLNIPVYLSGMARGLLGKGHRLQKRHKRRNALKEADVVLLSGVPNDFRLDYGSHVSRAHVISVNLSKDELRKNRRPEQGVLADPCAFISALAQAAGPSRERGDWFATLAERDAKRDEEIAVMGKSEGELVDPVRLCQLFDGHVSDDAILIGDGGDFVATAAYTVSPRGPLQWLDPGVFGTLGVGAGFAIGAKLVRPESDVWIIYGDGAAGFSIMEYDTFARHGLSVLSLVGNDAGWTQIERDQVVILGDDVACRLAYTDYHVVAEGCGGVGFVLEREAEVNDVLAKALAASREGKPVLVNAKMGRSDFRKGSISI